MSETKTNQDKKVFYLVLTLSIVVFAAVLILNRRLLPVPEHIPSFVYYLPGLNALINGTCSVLLIASLAAIKNKRISLHKKINLTAFFLSSAFLVSYILFHFYIGDTLFGDSNHDHLVDETEKAATGNSRLIYLIILATHIVLAAIVLPLVLLSFYHGLQNNVAKHRKLVRFSYPIWLYVAITGVVVYLMISPYYSF